MKFSSATISLFLFGSLFSLSSAKIDAPVSEEHSHSERRLQRGTQGNFFGVIRNRYQTVFLPRLCRLGLEFVYCVCNESSLNFKLGTGETEIQVCPGATIELTSPIDISGKSFTLSCAEAPCTIQGDGTTQLFTGSPGAITFQDLTFEKGDGGTDANGGAMAFTGGIVNIDRSTFLRNGADNGGAISLEGTTFTGVSVLFNENKAIRNGGAIYAVESTSITLDFCTFASSNSGGSGGALYLEGSQSTATIVDPLFSENIATGSGGAVYAQNSAVTVEEDYYFNLNQATVNGGAIASQSATINLKSGVFEANKAAGSGGAIYAQNSAVTLDDYLINLNEATVNGGAIASQLGTINMKFGRLEANQATASGGAIYTQNSTVTAESYYFDRNGATVNGGAIASQFATINLQGGTFKASTAMGKGNDIFVVDDADPNAGGTFIDCQLVLGGAQLNDFCDGTSGIGEEGEGTSVLGFPTDSDFSNTNCETDQISACN